MRIYARKELEWKKNRLMLGKEEICSVVPYKSKWSGLNTGMYKIKWPNGDLSKDYYNLSWAKENALRYSHSRLNSQEMAREGPPSVSKQLRAIRVPPNTQRAS
jgi:hypothetical protein